MRFSVRSPFCSLAMAAVVVCPALLSAQTVWPTRPIHIVSPGTPGQATDVLARALAQSLAQALGQPVVVDNRAGASGMIGTAQVAKAPADGYMLLVASSGPLVIAPVTEPNVPYNALKDFQYIANLAVTPQVLLVAADSPYRTASDLVRAGKARPQALAFGATGPTSQLAIELLAMRSGMKPNLVPFKGNIDATTQLIGGSLAAVYDTVPGALPLIKAGRVRALAVASISRSGFLPDTPTLSEAGFPGAEAVGWIGIAAPSGTPSAAVERLNIEIAKAMQQPEVQQQMKLLGFERAREVKEEFAAMVARELTRWAEVGKYVKASDAAPR